MHACQGINVEDVLQAVEVSRSTLQNRFRQILGRTIHDLIMEFRIQRAKALLAETSLSLEEVAERAGFKYVQYMSEVFRQRMGIRPGKFRAQHRPQPKIPLIE
ncbi:MAG TPA: helix-turn-helix transcriptional regulator [Thermoguttaceae bacterium]|nr:helix-turn-helix transcriptional regulator [Thermoguttaceae bacterium]